MPAVCQRGGAAEHRFFHWELEFPEVFFDRHGRLLGDDAGFDAVVGNPPYLRQEALGAATKGYYKAAFPETYHSVADLYVYFCEQVLRQLRRGGSMSYIVNNKWLKAGFGEPLRGYLASEAILEEIVDFGHAPIFPDADVFPCVFLLRKPRVSQNGAKDVRVAEFPRDLLRATTIERYVDENGYTVPRKRFGRCAWSLEPIAVDDLMQKVRHNGVPLVEFTGVKPLYGIKTGLNEAFLIDTATKERRARTRARARS